MVTEQKLLTIFECLANPIRLSIYLNTYKAEQRGINLNLLESVYPHNVLRSSITHHVNILVKNDILKRTKLGKNVHLSPNKDTIIILENFFAQITTNDLIY